MAYRIEVGKRRG